MSDVDVLVVSIEGTIGWQQSNDWLTSSLARAGAQVERVSAGPLPSVRTFALTDFVQARAARAAARRGIEATNPKAIVYCSITASLLWPRPGVIWLDSLAAENRLGRHGLWQRPVERRRLARAPLVLAMSERSLDPLPGRRPDTILVPSPVEPPPAGADGNRDLAAVTYMGNPDKKRLGFVLDAWSSARREGETMVVAGLGQGPHAPGVEFAGRLPPSDYRALLRRARVFIAAPKREDYGIAPLEALADGCVLVTTPAPGPYPARDIARSLDPRLVADSLTHAIRTALDDPRPGYPERAAELLAPFMRPAVDRTIAERVLPRLLERR